MKIEIAIKGKKPSLKYTSELRELFFCTSQAEYTIFECLDYLKTHQLEIDRESLLIIFKYMNNDPNVIFLDSQKHSFAGPFTMEQVVNSLFLFNLEYQDVAIKLYLEILILKSKKGVVTLANYQSFHLKIINVLSVVLRTKFFAEKPLFLSLTNIELDYIVNKVLLLTLDQKMKNESRKLLATGNIANTLAYFVQKQLNYPDLSLKDILLLAALSGTIWWSDESVQKSYRVKPNQIIADSKDELLSRFGKGFAIDDFEIFNRLVLYKKEETSIVYFLDDNGELVWHLHFIKLILEKNINLTVLVIVNDMPITNNVNTSTLNQVINTNHFVHSLSHEERFQIFVESNLLPSIDLRFCSDSLLKLISKCDFIIVNGVSFFEKIQCLPTTVFYLFTVYSHVSTLLTGLNKFQPIFACLPKNTFSFSGISEFDGKITVKKTLSMVHASCKGSFSENFTDI